MSTVAPPMSNLEQIAREIIKSCSVPMEDHGNEDEPDFVDKLVVAIHSALLSERERCAKIADKYEQRSRAAHEKVKHLDCGDGLFHAANQALDIAVSIRSQGAD